MSTYFSNLAHDFYRIVLLKFQERLTDIVKKDDFLSKSSYVLQALKILGPEEMLKLSEVLQFKQLPRKKAAGAELILWDDADLKESVPLVTYEATVLPFPQKLINDLLSIEEEVPGTQEEAPSSNIVISDILLWQRELAKQSGENVHKLDAFKGYKKSTEIYVVKTPSSEGKDKIHFASTNGVLVNKKQA